MHTAKKLGESRRIAIFRYLSGCRPNELQFFIDLLLDKFSKAFGTVLGFISNIFLGISWTSFEEIERICEDADKLFRIPMNLIKRLVLFIYKK